MVNMTDNLVIRWLLGLLAATLIVWVTGPFFLDSILLREFDPAFEQVLLKPGLKVYWRSEGRGVTEVGLHGTPGWRPQGHDRRIVLWGDSQLEGFCIDDQNKIGNLASWIAENQFRQPMEMISCGLSATSAADWYQRMPTADDLWQPSWHVWLVTDFNDLKTLVTSQTLAPRKPTSQIGRLLAKFHCQAFFHGGLNLLYNRETNQLKKLNWHIGPRHAPVSSPVPASESVAVPDLAEVATAITRVAQEFNGRLCLIYAPDVPTVSALTSYSPPVDRDFETLAGHLQDTQIHVIDMRSRFIEFSQQTFRLPRGFSNSYPGVGHLNADGNRLIATVLVEELLPKVPERPTSDLQAMPAAENSAP